MKKITLLVAVVFAFGIIAPVLAENISTDRGTVSINKTVLNVSNKEIKAQYQAAKADYGAAKGRYAAAKEEYNAAKRDYAAAKTDWNSAKKAFLENRNNINATKIMLERGKSYLLKIVDNRIRHLELVRSKVEAMAVLSDAEKAKITSELNIEIDLLAALKPEINAVTTKQGLKDVSEKIKAEWKNSRRGIERAAGWILAAREDRLAESAKNVSALLKTKIEALNASGKDTSELERILADFDAKIASANEDIAAAREKFKAAGNATTADEKERLIKEGKELLESAHKKIKDAHDSLKESIKNIRIALKEQRKEARENRTENEE